MRPNHIEAFMQALVHKIDQEVGMVNGYMHGSIYLFVYVQITTYNSMVFVYIYVLCMFQ